MAIIAIMMVMTMAIVAIGDGNGCHHDGTDRWQCYGYYSVDHPAAARQGLSAAQHDNLQTVEPEKAGGLATGQKHWRDAPQGLGGHVASPLSMLSRKIWMARSTAPACGGLGYTIALAIVDRINDRRYWCNVFLSYIYTYEICMWYFAVY